MPFGPGHLIISLIVKFFRLRNFLWRFFECQRLPQQATTNTKTSSTIRSCTVQFVRAFLRRFLIDSPAVLMLAANSLEQRLQRRRNRVLPKVLFLIKVILTIYLIVFCLSFNKTWREQHLAIVSTNYFPNSSIYAPNTMVLLFNAERQFRPRRKIVCLSRNKTAEISAVAKIRYAFTPVYICGWTTYIASCPVVVQPLEFGLHSTRFTKSSDTLLLPFKKARYEKLSVVACFSPLFYNERWQLILATLEIYRQMGVSLQVLYIQSMLSEIFDFLKEYESRKIAKLMPWDRIELGSNDLGYDPNAELEWRNQATAHTDCLLSYREAAEFVIVSDLDDVLIPRLGTNFLEEFQFLTAVYPSAAGFSYNRYNTELVTSRNPNEFSLASLINGARIADEWEDPKTVVRPSHVQTVWLHWPGIVDKGRVKQIPDDHNFMLHFRNWSLNFALFKYQVRDVMSPNVAQRIEHNFRNFISQTKNLSELYENLPQKVVYYPLISECYNRIFYGRRKRPVNCPGPLRCLLPPIPNLHCTVAKREHSHGSLDEDLLIHFTQGSNEFVVNNSGCTI